MQIGYVQYAPNWIKSVVGNAKAYAFFRIYENVDVEAHPVLRDRTEEMALAVKGISGKLNTKEIVKTGKEWNDNGFDPVGAQFVHEFKLIYA